MSTKLDIDELKNLPLAFATCSIGCKEEHTLPKKLDSIAAAGFQAIELALPDLVTFANQYLRPNQTHDNSKSIEEYHFDDLCKAAREVRSMCHQLGLKILMLQPFTRFEGWLEGSDQRKTAFQRLDGWMQIMENVGTDMLQVGSSDALTGELGRDREHIVSDLRELADKLAEKGFRVAYENWCWSTHAPDWEDVWDICRKVDRPNFGLCLDTFQSAGGEWGDPTTNSGIVEDGRAPEDVERDWQNSCTKLSQTIPGNKIFLLQISDAYKPREPFKKEVVDGEFPKSRWSHDFRPLPFEGYLPVVDFTKAVLRTGFRGWFSYEIFDSGLDGEGNDYELASWAQKARACQVRLIEACAE